MLTLVLTMFARALAIGSFSIFILALSLPLVATGTANAGTVAAETVAAENAAEKLASEEPASARSAATKPDTATSGAMSPLTATTFYSTATVAARAVDEAASVVTIIEREKLDELAAQSADQALRFVPGIHFAGDSSRSGLQSAQIRGGDPNFSLVLIDGVPVNDATDQVGGAFNLASLPTSGVERIEIVRGPLSAAYGSVGLAGAINVLTRRAESTEPRLTAELAAGSFDLLRAAAAIGDRGARHDLYVNLLHDEEQGRLAEDRFEAQNLYLNSGFEIDGRARLRLHARASRWQSDSYPQGSGGPVLGSGELRLAEHDEISLGGTLEVTRAGYRHQGRASVYRHRLDQTSPAILPLVPAAREDTTFTRARLGWTTTWQIGQATLTTGLGLDHERGDNRSLLFLPPFLGGDVRGDYDVDRTTPAAHVEWIGRTGELVYEISGRLDVPEDGDAELSPRAGLSFRPGGGATRLHASIGRAFKLPSFFAQFSPPQLGGNPSLEPETALGADLGVEQRFAAARLDLGVALFWNQFRDLIDFDFATFQNVNRARVETSGAELSLAWDPSTQLRIIAGLTYQEVDNIDSDAELRHRPDWLGSLRLVWRPLDALSFEIDGRSVGEAFDEQIPVPTRQTVASYEVFGVTASWKLTPDWQAHLRVANAADASYETFIGYPGPERSARLVLRYIRRPRAAPSPINL